MERNKTNDLQNYMKIKAYTKRELKKEEPILISHKSFLEIMLEQVKNYQTQFFSLNKNKKNMKDYLMKIKTSLSSINKEKLNKLKFLENKISAKKLKIQNQIFDKKPKKDTKEKQHYHYNSVNNLNYSKENNNSNELNNIKKINYVNEKQQLEILIFQLENEMEKIEFETQKKINLILNLRTYRLNQEENLEIIAEQKNLKSKAGRVLKKNLKNCQQNLLEAINQKIKNDLKTKKIKEEIENIKQEIKYKKEYIESDNIIFEESSDYVKSIVIDSEIININNEKEDNNNLDENKPNNTNKNNNNSGKKNKGNRHSVGFLSILNDKFPLNNNKNKCSMNLNDINDQINSKMIRSMSNKIKRINLNQFKNNCKLNINFNFNVNNLNIINGQLNEEQINLRKDDHNLSSNNNKFNKQSTFEKKAKKKINYEYNSDNEENKNRTKNMSFDNNSSLLF